MQARTEEERGKEAKTKIAHDFYLKLKLMEQKYRGKNCKATRVFSEEEADEYDDEFSFSRAFHGMNMRISVDEAYFKPVFPLFDQDILLVDGVEVMESLKANDRKVFVKMPNSATDGLSVPASTSSEDSPMEGKKVKVAGISKTWKIKDLMRRSKSDGREEKVAGEIKKKELRENKVKGNENKAKKVVKGKRSVVSVQERYTWCNATEEDQRRAYLAHRAYRL